MLNVSKGFGSMLFICQRAALYVQHVNFSSLLSQIITLFQLQSSEFGLRCVIQKVTQTSYILSEIIRGERFLTLVIKQ
jgi:hypothetical protein